MPRTQETGRALTVSLSSRTTSGSPKLTSVRSRKPESQPPPAAAARRRSRVLHAGLVEVGRVDVQPPLEEDVRLAALGQDGLGGVEQAVGGGDVLAAGVAGVLLFFQIAAALGDGVEFGGGGGGVAGRDALVQGGFLAVEGGELVAVGFGLDPAGGGAHEEDLLGRLDAEDHQPEEDGQEQGGDGRAREDAEERADAEQVAEGDHDDGDGEEEADVPEAGAEADDDEAGDGEDGDLEGDEEEARDVLGEEEAEAADRLAEVEVDGAAGEEVGNDAGGGDEGEDDAEPVEPASRRRGWRRGSCRTVAGMKWVLKRLGNSNPRTVMPLALMPTVAKAATTRRERARTIQNIFLALSSR